jgi:hypothetical protein
MTGPAAGGTGSAAPLRVGNASGFYGDRFSAVREMLTDGPLDVLTGDYLAELTMLILGRDRMRNPSGGYAKTFLRQLESCLGLAVERGTKIVTNAGGLNPAGLAEALRELAARLGVPVRIGYVTGDDLLTRADELELSGRHSGPLITANAYLGGWGIAACLTAGADIVVTGRVTDASLVLGPAAAHFGWARDDYDRLAGAVVAGHILECGAQATGGNYAFFTQLPGLAQRLTPAGSPVSVGSFVSAGSPRAAGGAVPAGGVVGAGRGGAAAAGSAPVRPGFPIAEIYADGSCVITKHPGTGGAVTVGTVTAQLLYEIDGPRYLGPDVTARFDTIELSDDGPDRVRVGPVRGEQPPDTLKVCLNHLAGFRNEVTFVLTGLDIEAKAELVRAQLTEALGERLPPDLTWTLARTEVPDADTQERASALLRVTVRDAEQAVAGRAFSSAAVELGLSAYPGCTLTAPPGDGAPYGVYLPAFVPATVVEHRAVLPDGSTVDIAPTWRPNVPGPASELPGDQAVTSTASATTAGPASELPGDRAVKDLPSARLPGNSDDQGAGQGDAGQGAAGQGGAGDGAGQGGAGPGRDGGRWGWGVTRRVPLGAIFGARSGDKGGVCNVGVWARDDAAFEWLAATLTVAEFQRLLPETRALPVSRYAFERLRALNFVVDGLLGEGVAAGTRFDPQGKGVGEWLRSRFVDVPEELLP